jgi:hypothetical protein
MKTTLLATAILSILTFAHHANAYGKDTVLLTAGQSTLVCETAADDENVSGAIKKLKVRLFKGMNILTTEAGPFLLVINAPYATSAVTMSSYDRAGSPDIACVTVTKQ